jgi:hypothetical protein
MIIQLNPPLPMMTPKGSGIAYFLTDYGIDYNHIWTVIIDETGEFWSFQNPEVSSIKNVTFGRVVIAESRL